MPIHVADALTIPDGELAVSFMRSGGPGGQNVNKVSSAVQLRWDLAGSTQLTPRVKARLRLLAGHRLLDDGAILIAARTQRSQEQNRRDAEQRLAELIRAALVEPKKRYATKPTKAARRRRVDSKTRRGSSKKLRGRPQVDD